MTIAQTYTFHIRPYDAASFDVEAHRVVAATYMLGVQANAKTSAVATGPVITLRRDNGADVRFTRQK